MRKHRLIHSGEKPFQCDRCSYRCARSSSLKRHLATHLNSVLPSQQPSQLQQQQVQQQQEPLHQVQHQIVVQPSAVQVAPGGPLEETKFHLALTSPLPPVSIALPQPQILTEHHQLQEQLSIHPQEHQQHSHEQLSQVTYDPNTLHYRPMKFA